MDGDAWCAAHAVLVARAAAAPAALERSLHAAWPPLDPGRPRRLVTTGMGSSEAHARMLAHVVNGGSLPARFAPLGALVEPPRHAAADALVVFSQGLSPNARLVLARARAWHRVIVATATHREERLADVRATGAQVVPYEGEDEYGTLVRVLGPLAAYAAALRLAAAFGVPVPLERRWLAPALAAARAAGEAVPPEALDVPVAFLASGDHATLARNLQLALLEGLLVPLPPVWELLHVAHGPFQQAFPGPHTFLALTRADAPGEAALLAKLEAMLDPERHRLLRLPATLPGALAILEHEVATTALLLRAIAHRHVDQARWPGRDRDAPLYALADPPLERRLAALAWPEVAALVARGVRTAVLPLGSIEQHGPHLPLGTDAWIAGALAERVCAAVPDALACPVLPVGCASEHFGFPGTLHAEPATLEAALRDTIAALGRHGIARVLVFSAHGGNAVPLAAMLPRLTAACAPMEIVACTDLAAVTATLHAAARAAGIDAGAAGHHAGEIETSILLAIRPGDVRLHALAPGRIEPAADAQHLFYPDLRAHAPTGTVGDPRAADAARGLVYLDAWARLLVAALAAAPTGAAKNRHQANGTKNP